MFDVCCFSEGLSTEIMGNCCRSSCGSFRPSISFGERKTSRRSALAVTVSTLFMTPRDGQRLVHRPRECRAPVLAGETNHSQIAGSYVNILHDLFPGMPDHVLLHGLGEDAKTLNRLRTPERSVFGYLNAKASFMGDVSSSLYPLSLSRFFSFFRAVLRQPRRRSPHFGGQQLHLRRHVSRP